MRLSGGMRYIFIDSQHIVYEENRTFAVNIPITYF